MQGKVHLFTNSLNSDLSQALVRYDVSVEVVDAEGIVLASHVQYLHPYIPNDQIPKQVHILYACIWRASETLLVVVQWKMRYVYTHIYIRETHFSGAVLGLRNVGGVKCQPFLNIVTIGNGH